MKVQVKTSEKDNFIAFYEHVRRRPGDVFSIPSEPRRALYGSEQRLLDRDPEAAKVFAAIKDKEGHVPQAFSFRWMEPVSQKTPERITTAQQALDTRSAEIKAEKAGQRALDTAKDDVI